MVVGQSSASVADCKPTVTIDVAPAINLLNQGSYVISGTLSAWQQQRRGDTAEGTAVHRKRPPVHPGTYSATFDANGVAQGTVTITATQTDGGGNIGTATRDTIKDTIVPAVTVDAAPSINATQSDGLLWRHWFLLGIGSAGNGDDRRSEHYRPLHHAIAVSGRLRLLTCQHSPTVPLSCALNSLIVSAMLDSGRVPPLRTCRRRSSQSTLRRRSMPQTRATTAEVTGTCSESGLPVSVSVGGIAVTPPPVCTAGGWSAAINATAIPVGTVAIVAAQTDAAGNSGSATRTTAKDIVAPSATVSTAPLINGANQSAYGGVTGTCSENGLAVVVAIASLVVSPAPLCVGGSWSITGVDVSSVPDGVITVSASQTDAAGNTGSGTRDTSKMRLRRR